VIYEDQQKKSATMENKGTRLSPTEMAQYRERLMHQKQFLTDILSKIEKQILALQVYLQKKFKYLDLYIIKTLRFNL